MKHKMLYFLSDNQRIEDEVFILEYIINQL